MNKFGLSFCPFCGDENVAILGSTAKFAYCRECGAASELFKTDQEVVAAWNRRADYAREKGPN